MKFLRKNVFLYIFQGRQSKNTSEAEEKGNVTTSPNGSSSKVLESDPPSTFQEEVPLLVDDLIFDNLLLGERSADVSSTSNDLDLGG